MGAGDMSRTRGEGRWSRYSDEFVCIPDYTRRDEHVLEFLTAYARRQNVRPVLFPTADPDQLLVSRWRARLEPAFALSLASPAKTARAACMRMHEATYGLES
jgi:D-aspartate ligase